MNWLTYWLVTIWTIGKENDHRIWWYSIQKDSCSINPPPKENPAKGNPPKVNAEVVSKRISEQLKDCLSECKVLSEQLRNTVNTFAEFKADVYKKVEELNNKYENDLKQIKSDVTYKIADLKREITKQGLNNE